MPITDMKIVGGYYTAGQSPQIVAVVNNEIADGWVPYGSPQLLTSGYIYQALVKGGGSCTAYAINTGYTDNRTPKMQPKVGWEPVGSPVALASNYFLQAYCDGMPYAPPFPPITVDDIEGISEFGLEVLTGDGIYSTDILDSTPFGRGVITGNGIPLSAVTGISAMGQVLLTTNNIPTTYLSPSTVFGRSLLNLADAAALRALIPVSNLAYRASFTTTGADITQNITSANTKQVITMNAEAIPNAAIGTMNLATGVFTFAAAFQGIMALSVQFRRAGTLLSPATFAFAAETSPDGVTWTLVAGSTRLESMPALSGAQSHGVDLAVAISVAAGDRIRFTQAADTVAVAIGVVANAAGIGSTTSAGLIFSLYTAR